MQYFNLYGSCFLVLDLYAFHQIKIYFYGAKSSEKLFVLPFSTADSAISKLKCQLLALLFLNNIKLNDKIGKCQI